MVSRVMARALDLVIVPALAGAASGAAAFVVWFVMSHAGEPGIYLRVW